MNVIVLCYVIVVIICYMYIIRKFSFLLSWNVLPKYFNLIGICMDLLLLGWRYDNCHNCQRHRLVTGRFRAFYDQFDVPCKVYQFLLQFQTGKFAASLVSKLTLTFTRNYTDETFAGHYARRLGNLQKAGKRVRSSL